MSDTKYTKKLTKTIEFDFWFEDEEAVKKELCGLMNRLDVFCKNLVSDYKEQLGDWDGFSSHGMWFDRDDPNADEIEYTVEEDECFGTIKFKVTEKWG